jgi:hypothetical protein
MLVYQASKKFRNMVVSNGNVDMEEGTLEIGMGMHFLFISVQRE